MCRHIHVQAEVESVFYPLLTIDRYMGRIFFKSYINPKRSPKTSNIENPNYHTMQENYEQGERESTS